MSAQEQATVAQETSGADELVLREEHGSVVRLTLNSPKSYNALSTKMMAALQKELDELRGRSDVKAVILGANGKGFCAGHDLKELRSNPTREFYEVVFSQCSRLMTSIVTLPQPVIAQSHGIAMAAGCQLVASCDLAVADENARFGTPGVNIGLFCSTPMVALSRNVPRKVAMEMLLTGETIDADKAVQVGLINRAVPAEELQSASDELARLVASKSRYVVKIGKEAFYRQVEQGLDDAYAYTSQIMVENMLARDAAEGIDAFIEKRTPQWSDE